MKNVVAIIGSPKPPSESVTYAVTNSFINALKEINNDITVEVVQLNQKNIMPCNGCLTCKQTGKCGFDDDIKLIENSMREADLLIFGSPVHVGHVSSVFQSFFERMIIPMHTLAYLGKPFVNVVTTNGSGEQEVDKYLTKIGLLFGCIKTGTVIKSANDEFKRKKYHKVILKTRSALSGNKLQPAFMNKMYFSFMKNLIKKNETFFKAEAEIWKRRGWFDKSYKDLYNALNDVK